MSRNIVKFRLGIIHFILSHLGDSGAFPYVQIAWRTLLNGINHVWACIVDPQLLRVLSHREGGLLRVLSHQGCPKKWKKKWYRSTNIPFIKSKIKLESRAVALPYHHVILVASITLAPCPCQKRERATFCRRQNYSKLASLAWRQRLWSCHVLKRWTSVIHYLFQRKLQVVNNYGISVIQQVDVF